MGRVTFDSLVPRFYFILDDLRRPSGGLNNASRTRGFRMRAAHHRLFTDGADNLTADPRYAYPIQGGLWSADIIAAAASVLGTFDQGPDGATSTQNGNSSIGSGAGPVSGVVEGGHTDVEATPNILDPTLGRGKNRINVGYGWGSVAAAGDHTQHVWGGLIATPHDIRLPQAAAADANDAIDPTLAVNGLITHHAGPASGGYFILPLPEVESGVVTNTDVRYVTAPMDLRVVASVQQYASANGGSSVVIRTRNHTDGVNIHTTSGNVSATPQALIAYGSSLSNRDIDKGDVISIQLNVTGGTGIDAVGGFLVCYTKGHFHTTDPRRDNVLLIDPATNDDPSKLSWGRGSRVNFSGPCTGGIVGLRFPTKVATGLGTNVTIARCIAPFNCRVVGWDVGWETSAGAGNTVRIFNNTQSAAITTTPTIAGPGEGFTQRDPAGNSFPTPVINRGDDLQLQITAPVTQAEWLGSILYVQATGHVTTSPKED